MQWWKAVRAQVVNAATELAKCVHQIADRALVHAGHAREFKVAAHQRQRGRQRAHGGAGVAHEELALTRHQFAAQPANDGGLPGLLDAAAHLLERGQHHGGVVRGQQVMHHGFALAQGGQQQHAVGNAFGAGQANRSVRAGQRGNVEKLDVKHEPSILMR